MDITGIVIRSVDYGEKDKLITVATPQGLYTVKVKGVKNSGSKLKGFVGIFNFGEFSVVEGRGGYTLSGANINEGFYNLWTDGEKYVAGMACLEIFEKCTRAGEQLDVVALLRALKDINYGEFYPLAISLAYGVKVAYNNGIDVSEGVFPDNVSQIFSALIKKAPEEVLTEYTKGQIDLFFKHLAEGFLSELGIKLTAFAKSLH